MSRSVVVLFHPTTPETLSLRALVLRRFLQAALVGIVSLASILISTIIPVSSSPGSSKQNLARIPLSLQNRGGLRSLLAMGGGEKRPSFARSAGGGSVDTASLVLAVLRETVFA